MSDNPKEVFTVSGKPLDHLNDSNKLSKVIDVVLIENKRLKSEIDRLKEENEDLRIRIEEIKNE